MKQNLLLLRRGKTENWLNLSLQSRVSTFNNHIPNNLLSHNHVDESWKLTNIIQLHNLFLLSFPTLKKFHAFPLLKSLPSSPPPVLSQEMANLATLFLLFSSLLSSLYTLHAMPHKHWPSGGSTRFYDFKVSHSKLIWFGVSCK